MFDIWNVSAHADAIDNQFSVECLLKELTCCKQNGKYDFDISNDNDRMNNKNMHLQVPTSNSKHTKNRLVNVVRHATGSCGD